MIEAGFIGSAEARKLHAIAAEEADSYRTSSRLVTAKAAAAAEAAGEDELPVATKGSATVTRPSELLAAILAVGRKGLAIQRSKGLGESGRASCRERVGQCV